jgi:hypothetical protein
LKSPWRQFDLVTNRVSDHIALCPKRHDVIITKLHLEDSVTFLLPHLFAGGEKV